MSMNIFIHFDADLLMFCHSALEEAAPDQAIQLYNDACVLLEDDGKEQMAFDLYRAAATLYVKLEK